MPKYEKFKEDGKILEQLAESLEKKENYYSRLEEISRELDGHKDQIEKINSALPESVSLPVLFDYIEGLSLNNGLFLNDISSSVAGNAGRAGEREDGENNSIAISISLTGGYSSFKDFLSAVYNSSRLIDVKSISFSSSGQRQAPGTASMGSAPNSGEFDFDVSLETYVFPKKSIPSGEAKGVPSGEAAAEAIPAE
ncbi:MAG TPA: hypothetical protein ENL27_02485 [Candidatus Parcubacteria bacterium]|nr:hypothetical protein [Candidatus Parcubacteria bacterium]